MPEREPGPAGDGGGHLVGAAAIRYAGYVIIVIAVLYFTALRHAPVLPLRSPSRRRPATLPPHREHGPHRAP